MRVRYSRATPGCPPARAEITPVEPDPGRTGEGSAPTVTSHDETPSWGIEPVPDRLRVLGFGDTFLLWTNLGISLLVLVAASYFGLSLPGRPRDDRRRPDRERDARAGRPDRRGRARADDGAAARAARPARLVPRHRPQRRPVPRLVGLRADRDRDGRRARSAIGSSASRASGMEARVRCARDRTRAARADRLRPPLREEDRDLGGRGLRRLPRLVDPRQRRRRHALAPGRRGRLVLGRRRSRDRAVGLVDPALGRLHALLDRGRRAAFFGAGLGYLLPTLFQFGFGAILVLAIRRSTGRPRC